MWQVRAWLGEAGRQETEIRAGAKGRSGGYRPGAGRPRKTPVDAAPVAKRAYRKKTAVPLVVVEVPNPEIQQPIQAAQEKQECRPPVLSSIDLPAVASDDPKVFLASIMRDEGTDPRLRIDAAKALMPFCHERKGETGKKVAAAENAGKIAGGKFARKTAPPKLAVVNK